jgi:hypothetical protein
MERPLVGGGIDGVAFDCGKEQITAEWQSVILEVKGCIGAVGVALWRGIDG